MSDLIAGIQESARRGDWENAGKLAAILQRQALPTSREELGEYLYCMNQALIVAKASRAHAAATLVRLNAAARFNNARVDFDRRRQEFGEAADF
jgi:uncharacterized protein (DUF2236 family)